MPVPAPSDSTQSPAPPDTTQKSPAPPDTSQKSPSPPDTSQNAPAAETDEYGFGAFGVPVPRNEDEGAACAIREKRTLR